MALRERPQRALRPRERALYAILAESVLAAGQGGRASTAAVYEATPWNYGGGRNATDYHAQSRIPRLLNHLRNAARYDYIHGAWDDDRGLYEWWPIEQPHPGEPYGVAVGSCYSQDRRTHQACGLEREHAGPHSWEGS